VNDRERRWSRKLVKAVDKITFSVSCTFGQVTRHAAIGIRSPTKRAILGGSGP